MAAAAASAAVMPISRIATSPTPNPDGPTEARRPLPSGPPAKAAAGYGQSEGGAAINPTADMPKGALASPVDGVDLAVISPETGEQCPPAHFDADGQLLNAGQAIGEIVNRSGRGKFEGYYKREDAEHERLRQGWYWTGDLGYVDDEGFFYFAGRTGDWLRVDSENFAAGPVEAVLSRNPDFAVVAVYPVPDTDSGAGDQVMVVSRWPGTPFDPADSRHGSGTNSIWAEVGAPLRPGLVLAPPDGHGQGDQGGPAEEAWACDDPVWWRPLGTTDIRFEGWARTTGPHWRPASLRTAGLPSDR